jgi:hypothetical protein
MRQTELTLQYLLTLSRTRGWLRELHNDVDSDWLPDLFALRYYGHDKLQSQQGTP